MPAGSPQARPTRLLTQQEKQARIYQEEVFPLFGQRQAEMLGAALELPPRAHVLLIGCGLGTTTTDILHQSDADSSLIAIESSAAIVERARGNVAAEYLGRRAFFRTHDLDSKLPFGDAAFDLILANVVVPDLASPTGLLGELVRVLKPGGNLRLATPLTGTWREFLDVYSDVLVRLRKNAMSETLAAYRQRFPEPEALARQMEAAGIGLVAVDTTHWDLVFRTGREFFYAPVIELGPLARWKAIAGKGPEMHDVFLAVKQAIDTYFAGMAFSVAVYVGIFSGTKP
jgi:ubiquinone/menaquinone biosynthesis C-methylase UbiE